MDRLEVVDPTGISDWDERLARHPEATVFHTAAWARVLSETYRYNPKYYAAVEDDRFVALLPFRKIRSWLTGTRGVPFRSPTSAPRSCPTGCRSMRRPVR